MAKVYRSQSDSVLGGVCSGLAEHLGIRSVFVRLFFVLLALGNRIGVGIYLLLWLLLPPEGQFGQVTPRENLHTAAAEMELHLRRAGEALRRTMQQLFRPSRPGYRWIIGLGLLGLSLLVLVWNPEWAWVSWLHPSVFWPALLIVSGLALLSRYTKGE